MLINGGQCVTSLDHLKVEQRGEAGEGEQEVRLHDRVAIGSDVTVGDRLADDLLDHSPPVAQLGADTVAQFRFVERLQDIGGAHPARGARVGMEG